MFVRSHFFAEAYVDGGEQDVKDGVCPIIRGQEQHKQVNMEDLIHVDKKWFYLTKDGQRFIIAADEEEPYRHVQHKSFLTKIMFLCAVARPRYDTNKNAWFDRKIGIWPIGKWEPAKRKSKKRAKGTPVWKNQLTNRDVYREYLIQKLLPVVKEKWPRNHARIRLQQDGAKSHILEDDVEFKEAVQQIGLNLTVFTQAPNSPDTNILDLGFFRAIQSFNNECPDNEEELIKSVEKAYGEYPWCKLNFVWLTLQSCLNKIIEHDGGNDYKIPHMGKESLWRRGRLPEVLHVTPAANAWLNPKWMMIPIKIRMIREMKCFFPCLQLHLRLQWMEKEEKTHLQMELLLQVSNFI